MTAQITDILDLADRVLHAIEATDTQLIGTTALGELPVVRTLPGDVVAYAGRSDYSGARYAAEDLVERLYDWVVDDQNVLQIAKELRGKVEDLEDNS